MKIYEKIKTNIQHLKFFIIKSTDEIPRTLVPKTKLNQAYCLRISWLFKPTFRHESKGITYVKISFQFSKAQSSLILNAKSGTKRARCALARTSSYKTSIARGPSLYYVSKETGWVRSEKWQFLLTFSTIYADEGWVDGRVRKSKNLLTYYRDGP